MAETYTGIVKRVDIIHAMTGPVWRPDTRKALRVELETNPLSGLKIVFETPAESPHTISHWFTAPSEPAFGIGDTLRVRATKIRTLTTNTVMVNRVRRILPAQPPPPLTQIIPQSDPLICIAEYEDALTRVASGSGDAKDSLKVVLEAQQSLQSLRNLVDVHLMRLEDHAAYLSQLNIKV